MKRSTFLLWVTSAVALFHIIAAGGMLTWFGYFMPAQVIRGISLLAGLVLVFFLHRARPGKEIGEKVPWYDYLLMASALTGAGYIIFFNDNVVAYGMFGRLDTTGMILAILLCIPLIEAVRRQTGWALPIITLFFLCITLFQNYLPGILNGQGFSLEKLFYATYVGTSGIFGMSLGVASTILIIYLIFGALFQRAGAGQWFMDIAMSITGWTRGGPAKVAVLSSALFGSISGSPASNVATTGAVTIPLMIKSGYSPKTAAATEAVAATGGQILPPVMGAIAFVMAEWIGVPYAEVALAAIIPALLYYLTAFITVHLIAHKEGIERTPLAALPRFWKVMKQGWFYLIPLFMLIYFLIIKALPAHVAGIYSLPFLIGCSFLSKDRANWLTPKNIFLSFQSAVFSWLMVVVITGAVGIMTGALELSGLGIKFSRFITDVAGGDLLLTLVLVGIASLILGTALDALPSYITLATLLVPALISLGISDMAAHLFVVYWGLASFLTPPTCVSVFVAIGISGSKIWETGWEAMRIGIAAYIVPFAFVYSQGLLLQGDIYEISWAVVTAIIGVLLVACGTQGFSFAPMNMLQRAAVIVAGCMIIAPGILMPAIGAVIAIIVLFSQKVIQKRETATAVSNRIQEELI
ncbi:TRAP transporter [Cohnella kolymensis]|uniref:TRAP transporter n=1 Tax=Cohnella kolymensis TaxID=1590652 RepID=A0ABR5A8L4_9BACL|nr:TRAP transporter fused permease subunit [Cohnella kolymensis]KIL37359.1 TRAP transporter [Cohnella kolymensis]